MKCQRFKSHNTKFYISAHKGKEYTHEIFITFFVLLYIIKIIYHNTLFEVSKEYSQRTQMKQITQLLYVLIDEVYLFDAITLV